MMVSKYPADLMGFLPIVWYSCCFAMWRFLRHCQRKIESASLARSASPQGPNLVSCPCLLFLEGPKAPNYAKHGCLRWQGTCQVLSSEMHTSHNPRSAVIVRRWNDKADPPCCCCHPTTSCTWLLAFFLKLQNLQNDLENLLSIWSLMTQSKLLEKAHITKSFCFIGQLISP